MLVARSSVAPLITPGRCIRTGPSYRPSCARHGTDFLFCSSLGCVLSLQTPSAKVPQLSLSFAAIVHTVPRCRKISSVHTCSGLPTDPPPPPPSPPSPLILPATVLLNLNLLSIVLVMRPAHFHFALVTFLPAECIVGYDS